jgi:hypothetical protein
MVSDKHEASDSGSDDRADGFATITFRKVFGYRKALAVWKSVIVTIVIPVIVMIVMIVIPVIIRIVIPIIVTIIIPVVIPIVIAAIIAVVILVVAAVIITIIIVVIIVIVVIIAIFSDIAVSPSNLANIVFIFGLAFGFRSLADNRAVSVGQSNFQLAKARSIGFNFGA